MVKHVKVLNIVKYYYPSKGGMETFAKILSEGLMKKGFETTILTINHQRSIPSSIENIGGIRVWRVGCWGKVMSQPLTIFFRSALEKLIVEHDLVHLNCPFPNVEIYSQILLKKPLIITWHANPLRTRWKPLALFYRPILYRVLKHASKVVVTSSNLLKFSISLEPFKNKCSIIPLSFRFGSKNPCCTSKVETELTPTVLFVGALRPYKGVKYLIRAMSRVKNAKLEIIGTGEEEDKLKQLTRKLQLDSRVIFHNNVNDEELQDYYKRAFLFVLPSISDSEAFGIVQLEAMSFGLPVINTDLQTGVPYVSLHGSTGFTVPPKDEFALADAINRLLQDRELYETFSKNAIDRSKEFTEDKMVDKYVQLYREILY